MSVFLHYDELSGLYFAFGLSAYYADMGTDPILSYSEKLQMPVAILQRSNVLDLRQGMTMVSHTAKESYHFRTTQFLGKLGYDKWVEGTKKNLP